jgi:PAS domain S-box-containing protein
MPLNKLTSAEQLNFLRLVLDSTMEGFYSVDTEGKTTLCNAAFLRMLGYDSPEEVVGRKLHDEIHHAHPDGTAYIADDCPIYQAARTGTSKHVPYEVFFRKDGTRFPVEYRAEPIYEDGELKGAVCTFSDISERVAKDEVYAKLQNIAHEALERIDLALNSGALVGTWVWDTINDKVRGDARFAKTFSIDSALLEEGIPLADVIKLIHPDDITNLNTLITEALEKGGTFRSEYRVRNGNGGWLWVEGNGTVEKDSDGRAVRFPGILIDINERKHIEETLQETHEQLKLAQKAGGIGVFVIERGATQIRVSPEFCTIFGVEETELLETAEIEKQILEEDRHLQSTIKTRANGTAPLEVEYRIRRKNDGALRWISRRAEFIRDRHNNVLQMTGIIQDITDKKNAALMLQENQDYLNLIIESAQDYAIISLDEEGKIVIWNTGAERMFGHTPDDVVGKSIEVIFTPEDRAHNAPQYELTTAAEKGRANDERWHMRKNGERFYASGTMAAMTNEKGRIKGFVKIARDITAQQHAKEALLEARNAAEAANIAKTEFLANMSHEIRTPMNAIIGLSNILSMSQPLTQKQREFIKTLQMSADSLLTLINDLLDIAKIEARTVELEHIPFSLTRLMQEIVSMMAVQVKDKQLSFTGSGECVQKRMFLGDPTRLRQIIVNLCSNAIKFTDTGGVHISIACEPSQKENTEHVSIAVTDTGIGIPPEKLDNIFQKFVQADTSINRKYGGTGLGLAITKTLAEIMGGSICVESEVGKGSTFKVTIPLELATDHDVGDTDYSFANIVETTLEKKIRARVLLVEDYEPNVLVATTFLEQFGYTVEVASNGLEAFEMIKHNTYDVALMDVQMHGMNGFEATRLIREREKKTGAAHLHIIGMTAHALTGDRERCLAVGMDDYISKPFNPDELQSKIKAAFSLEGA